MKGLALARGHCKFDHYWDMYGDIFPAFRDKPIRLLEIGLGDGNSLRMWRDYFPLAAVVGLDNNPAYATYAEGRVEVVIGDQADVNVLESLGCFDVVIDDGGHWMNQQIISLHTLWRQLNAGGWYFIEDLQVCYGMRKEDYYKGMTTMDHLKACLDGLNVPGTVDDMGACEFRFMNGLVGIRKAQ